MINKNEPIIDMHDTWLALNPVQGCTNGCKYCLLQGTDNHLKKPCTIIDSKEIVKLLLQSKYYDSKIPICIMPGTDPFLNGQNIEYLNDVLNSILDYKLSNPIIIITKCLIPEKTLLLFQKMIKNNLKIVIYLSYSGLSKKYEPNINHDNIRLNFQNLKKYNIPIVHYYRPFLEENSNPKTINEILDFVNKYTDISFVGGLKVRSDFIDKLDFIQITKTKSTECLNASSIWPKSAYDYFFKNYQHKQNIFQTNYCALAQALKIPCPQYYGTYECSNYNKCSKEQRNICSAYKKDIIENEIIYELIEKLGYKRDNIEISRKDNNIILYNSPLSISDAAFLMRVLGTKISISEKKVDDIHFSSSITNSKPLLY